MAKQLDQKEKIAVIISGVLLVLFILSLFWQKKPRILILHSYNLDYTWTADLDQAIHRVLDGKPYDMTWRFMDTKNKTAPEYKENIGNEIQSFINSWQPNVIIAADDDAQEYVAKKYVNTSIKIVFCGVNKEASDYGYDKANNVTGLLERQDYVNTKNILYHLLLSPQKRFIHLSEDSTTALGTRKELEGVDWSPIKFVSSIQAKNFSEWQEVVTKANEQADLILISQYNSVKKQEISEENQKDIKSNPASFFGSPTESIPPKDLIKWTLENSKIPVIGLFQFFVDDGGSFSAGPSEDEHGEFAAKTAIDLIEGNVKIKNVPIIKNKRFTLSIRNKQGKITKRQMTELDLSAIYDAYALLGK